MTGKATLTAEVFEQIRKDLLAARYEPGSKLLIASLSGRLAVSPSVVREALSRLAEQGLVVATPQRGFRVMSISSDDLVDLTRTRIDIETLAVRRSVEQGTLVWETDLVATHHTLARTPAVAEAGEAWRQAHREFHRALLSGSGSPRLESIAAALRDSAEMYQTWASFVPPVPNRDIAAEHEALLKHALARQTDETSELLAAHIQRTTDTLLACIQSREPDREHGDHSGVPEQPDA